MSVYCAWCSSEQLCRTHQAAENTRLAIDRRMFAVIHNTLAPMQGYPPIPTMDHAGACREAFRKVRRDVWDDRESRLRATWESYG